MLSLRSIAFPVIASLFLTACVTDPSGTALIPQAPLLTNEAAYAPVIDAGLNVPGVPVDQVPAEFQRQSVAFETDQAPGTIIINPAAKQLYFVTGRNQAIRYGIAVGKAGFQWSGEALITERKTWPTWTPPEEMIERKPELRQWEKGMPGGLENPLGARALYLTTNGVDYGYRIHGTPEWFSIGKNASSGCIRMINQDVMDLYGRVGDGAKVIVLNADGSMPSGLTLPPPQPKKPKPVVDPTPVVAPVVVPPVTDLPPYVGGPAALPAAVPAFTPAPEPLATMPAAAEPAPCLITKADGTCLCTVPLIGGLCPIL